MGPEPAGAPSIALMAQDAFVSRTGIGRYQTALISHLYSRTNLHVLVLEKLVSRSRNGGLPEPLRRSTVHRYSRPRTLLRNALPIAAYTVRSTDLFTWRIGTCLQLVSNRVFPGVYIDRAGFDLVHGTANFLPRMHREAARVVTIHDTIPLTHPRGLPKIVVRGFIQPHEIRPEDHIITDSVSGQQAFAGVIDHPPDHLHVIPIAIDHDAFHTVDGSAGPPAGSPPYILSVGAIAQHKNLPRGLEAFERLAKRHPELRWKIVGLKAWGWDEFRRALAGSTFRNRVDVLGLVPDSDLADLYRGARALLFPSLTEGFGIPVAEALACGTPVAASNIPAVRELAGEAFLPFDPRVVGSIAEAVERAAFDADGRERRRQIGMERTSQLRWPPAVDRHLEVYAKALDLDVDSLLTEKG